ncbi:helix-turn-helix domain-containing protein [Amycolatopsis thermophila]|uniref:Transcriptional regulator with XRE-family HTH domain n=1 Tax=Amycolatopsis thermophila TaxID=206084 RepID=A0ABU0ERP3_9PSEU|nr:helix-turn-helix transcriptional regulator [Amycolatopsis thermophila]MDQ0377970.1 transcriptional regulator with XRE-family HTH domain [Amycolatopsis thermophila]
MTEINERRLALGDELRLLCESAHVSGKQLAEKLGWHPSKMSRIWSAKQAVSDRDLIAIARGLALPEGKLEELRAELRAIRLDEARWNRQLRGGHSPVQEAVAVSEQQAATISSFALTLVPGLAHTADYARWVFRSLSALHDSPPDTEAAVRRRMERQHILYDESKQIELLTTEHPFRYPVAPAAVMLAQIDRLLALQGIVRFGIIPAGRPLPAAVAHSFVVRDETVAVELVHTEVVTSDPGDGALYRKYLDALWAQADEGDDARALLSEWAREFRRRG